MIKTLFIVLVSVVVSAFTTVGLMWRYSRPVEQITGDETMGYVVERPVEPEKAREEPGKFEVFVEAVEEMIQGEQLKEVVESDSVEVVERSQSEQRVFDHKLLARDIASVTKKLESFNKMLETQIDKLKTEKSEE